jgi:hypothetical protein
MSKLLKKNYHHLHVLNCCRPNQRNSFLKTCQRDFIHCLCEICYNILRGNVPVSNIDRKKLEKYKTTIRLLATKRGYSFHHKKRAIIQKGGFLPLILPTILAIASELIPKLLL